MHFAASVQSIFTLLDRCRHRLLLSLLSRVQGSGHRTVLRTLLVFQFVCLIRCVSFVFSLSLVPLHLFSVLAPELCVCDQSLLADEPRTPHVRIVSLQGQKRIGPYHRAARTADNNGISIVSSGSLPAITPAEPSVIPLLTG